MEIIVAILALLAIGGAVYFIKSKKDKTEAATLTLSAGDAVNISRAAPVTSILDSISGVVIGFTEVIIQPEDGDRLSFPFEDVKSIDLMGDSGNGLLDNQEVPVGKYSWIRLVYDSKSTFVKDINDVVTPLSIPSGELKLIKGFYVGEDGADFTIDFNLASSLKSKGGPGSTSLFLKPVLKLVDNLTPPAPEPEEIEEAPDTETSDQE